MVLLPLVEEPTLCRCLCPSRPVTLLLKAVTPRRTVLRVSLFLYPARMGRMEGTLLGTPCPPQSIHQWVGFLPKPPLRSQLLPGERLTWELLVKDANFSSHPGGGGWVLNSNKSMTLHMVSSRVAAFCWASAISFKKKNKNKSHLCSVDPAGYNKRQQARRLINL